MSIFFKVIRWLIAVFLLIPLLFSSVLALTPVSGVSKIITERDNIKGYLKDSGIYNKTVDILLEFITPATKEEDEGEDFFADLSSRIKDKNSELGQLVSEVLTPTFFENSFTTAIDATYDWLEGKTNKPTFVIKITEDKNTFIRFLSVTFKEKMAALPECDVSFNPPPNFDPLGSKCRPRGFNLEEIDRFIQENSEREEFSELFNKATINSESLNIDQDVTKKAQWIFSILKPAPQITYATILLLSALLILVIPGFKKGLIITGAVLLLSSLMILFGKMYAVQNFDFWANQGLKNINPDQVELIRSNFEGLVKAIYSDLLNQIQFYSLLVSALGVVLIVVGILIKSKGQEEQKGEKK